MTPRSLWTIILKCFGLYFLYESLAVLPMSVTSFVMAYQSYNANISENAFFGLVILITLVIYLGGIYMLLFKTDWIIDKLALEKHFREEKFELKIHRSTIIQIAIIVIGGQLFVVGLPQFCKQLFSFYQQNAIFRESQNAGMLIFQFVEIFIGYLLLTNSRRLTAFVEKARKTE